MKTILRKSKFFTCFFGDGISEKDFYGKNFSIACSDSIATFSFELIKGLDYKSFEEEQLYFDTFIVEDVYLVNKTIRFLKENSDLKYFKLSVIGAVLLEVRVARIKFDSGKLLLHTF
jgi:hypothetical protein